MQWRVRAGVLAERPSGTYPQQNYILRSWMHEPVGVVPTVVLSAAVIDSTARVHKTA